MNKNIKDMQKSEEVEVIERFINLLNISPENEAVLVENNRESPDFILKIIDKIIGFELSEIIDGKENIAADTSIKINALLFQSIKDDLKYSFLNEKAINIRFFKDNDINQKIFSSIINQIKQFLFFKKDKILVKQIFYNDEFDKNYKLLKKIIKKITVFPISVEEPMIEISNRQVFSYSIEQDILKIIESKNEKLLKYKKNNKKPLNYYALLLYIKNSSLYKIESEVFKAKKMLKEFKQDIDFDYVYLFNFMNSALSLI